MREFKMGMADWTALTLVVVGALNWGLVGVAHFVSASANWNLVNILFGSVPEIEFLIYVLVGISSLWVAYMASRMADAKVGKPISETDATRQSAK